MAKKFVKILDLSNSEANQAFDHLCIESLKKPVREVKEELGIPVSTDATMKDLVTLIQEKKMEASLTITFDDSVAPAPTVQKEEPLKKNEAAEETTTTEIGKSSSGGDDLPF